MSIKLILGDCRDHFSELKNKVDLVVTSPPYDSMRTYEDTLEWNFNIFKEVAEGLTLTLKDGGVICWIVGDETINGSETGSSFKQALYFKETCGLNLHDTMIWNKGGFSAVGSLKTRYAPVFEYIFIFSKGKPKTFCPIKDRVNKSYGRKITGTNVTSNRDSRRVSSYGKLIEEYGQRFNIWEIPAEMNRNIKHPAPFPLSLAKDLVISWSNLNDLVLDPFLGSGTTALACKELNRNFIGTELVSQYYTIAKTRVLSEVIEPVDWFDTFLEN